MLRYFGNQKLILRSTNARSTNSYIISKRYLVLNNKQDEKETVIDLLKKVKLTPTQKRKKAAELAKTSLLDIFDFVSNGTADDLNYKEHLDMPKILNDPKLFAKLTFNQQEQVIDNLDHYRYEEWTSIPNDAKKLMYFISYGNWGPRNSFKDPLSFATSYIPEDIPFKIGSLNTNHPSSNSLVHKLPKVNLMLASKEREKLFNKDVRSLDPMSQVVVVFVFGVSIIAIIRDKFFNNEERIKDTEIIDENSEKIVAE